jgi:GAF domain-containing protein
MKTQPKQRNKSARASKTVQVKWGQETLFKVPIPKNEEERVAELHEFQILDTPPDEILDSLTLLASHICETPIALITLIDSDRQWFKSRVGVTITETARDISFCAHAIMSENLYIVPDLSKDKRFARHPFVMAAPRIRFYAGAPLVTRKHRVLGTLCVLDRVPRKLSKAQYDALRMLSRQVMAQLEMSRQVRNLQNRLAQQRHEHASLTRQFGRANARQRAYEEALRRIRDEMRAGGKGILNLVDQAIGTSAVDAGKRTLRSIRGLVQSMVERTVSGS